MIPSRLKRKAARFESGIYIRILQIIGICGVGFFASCVKAKYGTPEPEYGVPYYDIRFHGTIKSEDSLKSIPGLRVSLISEGQYDSVLTNTDNQGTYELRYNGMEGSILKLKIHDPDSAANTGDFRDKSVDIEIGRRDVNNSEKKTDVLMQKK